MKTPSPPPPAAGWESPLPTAHFLESRERKVLAQKPVGPLADAPAGPFMAVPGGWGADGGASDHPAVARWGVIGQLGLACSAQPWDDVMMGLTLQNLPAKQDRPWLVLGWETTKEIGP